MSMMARYKNRMWEKGKGEAGHETGVSRRHLEKIGLCCRFFRGGGGGGDMSEKKKVVVSPKGGGEGVGIDYRKHGEASKKRINEVHYGLGRRNQTSDRSLDTQPKKESGTGA